jgi:DNA-binding NtrC family response regulator
MNTKGPILLIENNTEDRQVFDHIFSELGVLNQILYFNSVNDAYHHVSSNNIDAFLIFSDIASFNMSDKQVIHITYKNLSMELNCPCLFFTTAFNHSFVIDLYSVPAQSYVVKPYNYNEFKQIIKNIIEHWSGIKSIEDYKSDPIKRNNIQNNLN